MVRARALGSSSALSVTDGRIVFRAVTEECLLSFKCINQAIYFLFAPPPPPTPVHQDTLLPLESPLQSCPVNHAVRRRREAVQQPRDSLLSAR